MRRSILSVDGGIAILFAAVGGLVTAQSIVLGFGEFSQPGPGLFPFFAGFTILISALVVITKLAIAALPPLQTPIAYGRRSRLIVLVTIFALWILLIPLTGFVIGTFVCVIAFAKVLRLEGWVKPLLLGAATSGGIYILFSRLLQLDLPSGPWGL